MGSSCSETVATASQTMLGYAVLCAFCVSAKPWKRCAMLAYSLPCAGVRARPGLSGRHEVAGSIPAISTKSIVESQGITPRALGSLCLCLGGCATIWYPDVAVNEGTDAMVWKVKRGNTWCVAWRERDKRFEIGKRQQPRRDFPGGTVDCPVDAIWRKYESRVTIHTLRHSFVTNLLRAGVPISKVSKWCGHSSIRVTAGVYGHVTGHDPDIDRF